MATTKVYTESVITLNASQADATMKALESRADELRKKMIEATRVGDVSGAKGYQKELDSIKKSMTNIRKETKDYADLLNDLNGLSLNQLTKAFRGLNSQLRNLVPGTDEFIKKSKELQQVKDRMNEINGRTQETQKTFGGFWTKIGWAGLVAGAFSSFKKFGEDVISTTNAMGDKWNLFTAGMKSAYGTFIRDLTSGKGWKEMIANMRESYRVGQEVQGMLDELFEMQNSLRLMESEYNAEIEKNKQIMRDQTKSDEERLAAAQAAVAKEKELADQKKTIAETELIARKEALVNATHMTDEEIEYFVVQYNKNRDIINQALKYNEQLKKAQSDYNTAQQSMLTATNTYTAEFAAKSAETARKQLESLKSSTSEGVKWIADLANRYDLSNDELINSYVDARIAMNNADADFYRSTTRINTTIGTLKKQMADEQLKATEDTMKAELEASERHFQEMENASKEAYSRGEITAQQYNTSITRIQEQGLQAKIAISERYKQDTAEYFSQLYDLSVKQREELQSIFDKTEEETAAGISSMMQEEMERIAQEVEALASDEATKTLSEMTRLQDLVAKMKADLDPVSQINTQYESEKADLQSLYDMKLISEEEYQQKRKDLIRKYQQEILKAELEPYSQGLDLAQGYLGEISNCISSLQAAQEANLDAQMQEELAAAGDNADKRSAIEEKYEAKKLELQKKYANINMGIQIAQTIASGAQAAIKAVAELGPIAGGIMAGIIAATTAAQVAVIVAQRNAVMNASAGSGGSSAATGQRVATEFSSDTGYSEGGYTKSSHNDYEPVGVVHANEWVAPAAMVRANPVTFARLEAVRVSGHYSSGVAGFADGGMTSGQPVQQFPATASDAGTMTRLTVVLERLLNSFPLKAYVLASDINKENELQSKIKQKVGKK